RVHLDGVEGPRVHAQKIGGARLVRIEWADQGIVVPALRPETDRSRHDSIGSDATTLSSVRRSSTCPPERHGRERKRTKYGRPHRSGGGGNHRRGGGSGDRRDGRASGH